MLNTLKLLLNRFAPKAKVEHQAIAQNQEPQQKRAELIHIKRETYDIHEIRQRVNEELRVSDVSARQRDREFMNKWFQRSELTNSGNFNIAEIQRRMEEYEREREEEECIAALPLQEDILLAFAKPEYDLFEDEKISLSGVFLKVDPNEDFDEHYSTPLLPMYRSNEEHYNELKLHYSCESNENIPALKTLMEEISIDDTDIEETLEELIATDKPIAIPAPIPAFIVCPVQSSIDERPMTKINPSALFEEWTSEVNFEPACTPTEFSETESAERVSIADKPEVHIVEKPAVKLVSKPSANYWSESDRLTRFGRRKTSGSCSSTRSRNGMTQIA